MIETTPKNTVRFSEERGNLYEDQVYPLLHLMAAVMCSAWGGQILAQTGTPQTVAATGVQEIPFVSAQDRIRHAQ